jgi:hypothetical protein
VSTIRGQPHVAEQVRSLECVDPSLEASGLAGHELGLSEGAGQDGAALVSGNELDRQVVCAASPHGAEMLLGPIEWNLHQRFGERI